MLLLSVAAALVVQAAPAAAAGGQPGGPCSSSTASAMNQYCEVVPSATGGHGAGPGSPALASQLPPSEVSALGGGSGAIGVGAPAGAGAVGGAGGTSAGRAAGTTPGSRAAENRARASVLTLPAPGPRVPIAGTTRLPSTSDWSLVFDLVAVLVGVTAAACGLALLARRRRASAP